MFDAVDVGEAAKITATVCPRFMVIAAGARTEDRELFSRVPFSEWAKFRRGGALMMPLRPVAAPLVAVLLALSLGGCGAGHFRGGLLGQRL